MVSYTRCGGCGETITRSGPDTTWAHVTETGTSVPCRGTSTNAYPVGALPVTNPEEVTA